MPDRHSTNALGPNESRDALAYAESILAAMREPFLVLDTTLRVKTANRCFCSTFSVTREETEGRFLHKLGDGQWNVPELLTRLRDGNPEGDRVEDYLVEHDFPTIGKRSMLLSAGRFGPAPDAPDLILLAFEDVTERRRADAIIRSSEARYRRLFETAQDGILILDAATLRIIDANHFMTELLGYAYEDFLGKELWEIGFFKDKDASQSLFRELQQRGYVRYDHVPLKTKSGTSAEVEFISNVYDVDQRAVAQCNIRDISERTRMELLLREQTAALAELDRRKDEFLAMLSHELRNPLAPIANAVQILRLQKDEDPVQRHARDMIERQVRQLARLVDDLMEVSRITTGMVQLHRSRITISSVVERAVETTRELTNQHQFTVTLPAQPVWLDADAPRLEQVVVNLLTNAAKYTDPKGVIRLTVSQEDGACVLRLQDSGIGIAPDLLPHIFELFTQSQRSLDRSRGGLGIGLALVQQLVHLHGGTVEAHSILGEGSEFVVRLPLTAALAPAAPPAGADRGRPVARASRVLIVDDNVDAAESLAHLVKALGHDVRTTYDGAATLTTAAEYRPDVVLLDIGLPGVNGYDIAAWVREQPVLKHTVLVAITGYGNESDRERSRTAGFDHHLVKPADFSAVRAILATTGDPAHAQPA